MCDELVIGGGLNLHRRKDIKFSSGLIKANIAISNENVGVDFFSGGQTALACEGQHGTYRSSVVV